MPLLRIPQLGSSMPWKSCVFHLSRLTWLFKSKMSYCKKSSRCTDGQLSCDANVYGGKTQLIASHIHYAKNGDGRTGEGPPVLK